ncbi:hypothetical protein DAPPUDRAFT_230572 [Daphnia pulex]|uniref:Macro domain-containing protein n=1 Tax=Daphnia pulex TaxID=6669 RepID=E9G619_DAPPU|nr:hypothetical protein DAPPUDRAFT_230572 [Daphnia pulex]|eukprot:EFX85072.1 hypothetical protein DAPPUDRAFT_230572 [Daphnia pulex]
MYFIQTIGKYLIPKEYFNKSISIMAKEFKNWQEAKAKYLEESTGTQNQQCVSVKEIPTWEETSKEIHTSTSDGNNTDSKPNLSINSKVSLWKGDITQLEVGAIVNAANSRLAGGGGVDGAIHKAAGPYLLEECQSIKGGCQTGDAKLTGGYKLPAKYVIQTVGPMNRDSSLLSECYSNSLKLANDKKLKTIVFPCISTGVFGYPNRDAAVVALSTTKKFLESDESTLERVIFCVFLEEDLKVYKELLPKHFPVKAVL